MTYLCGEKLRQLRCVSQNLIQTDLQALDVKHLAEFENFYRYRCRVAIQLYKDWMKHYEQETDSMQILYGSIEGMMLRSQASDAVKLYWIIRQDFRTALHKYLSAVTGYNSLKKIA